MDKRFLTWIFVLTAFIVALSLYAGAFIGSYRLNTGAVIVAGGHEAEAISIPIDYNTVTDIDGVTYTIDLGSPHSFIADSTLTRLRQIGTNPDSIPTLVYTTCPDETARLFSAKYHRTALFLSSDSEAESDTVAISNAEFLCYPGGTDNIIGLDILENFVVEYIADSHRLRLQKSVPDNYSDFASISKSRTGANDCFTYAARYYIDLAANHNDVESFRLDSGREMAYMYILLPADEAESDEQRGTLQPHECWVDISDRSGFTYANYIDIPTVEPYALNLFVFFEQDFVIDFPSKKVYLRPSSSTYARAISFDRRD